MTTARIKVAAGLTLTIAVAFGGGYAWARMVSQPEIVEIGSIACGVPPLTASFGVPLQAVLAAVGDLPFGVGPVDVPEGGGRVYLLFHPTADGKRRDVRLVDATLTSADPVRTGRSGAEADHDQLPGRSARVGALPGYRPGDCHFQRGARHRCRADRSTLRSPRPDRTADREPAIEWIPLIRPPPQRMGMGHRRCGLWCAHQLEGLAHRPSIR